MGGAASGARTAAAGLSVPAALPIDKGQLFLTRGAARTASETELATAGRAIKNGSSSGRVTFHVVCKICGVECVCSMRRVSSENGGAGPVPVRVLRLLLLLVLHAKNQPENM